MAGDGGKPASVDTGNKFLVSVIGRELVILAPPQRGAVLSADAAINLAAWLVVLVPGGRTLFDRALREIEAT